MLKVNAILQGDALAQLRRLPDESVDCVLTSPPYWGLRDYGASVATVWGGDGDCAHEWQPPCDAHGEWCAVCGAWKGQLGLEPAMELFLEHLSAVFDEVRRVLTPRGSCWVNLGDKYAGAPRDGLEAAVAEKSLCLAPFRFAIAMVERGWLLRNTVIWHKPNCMPASARDRFTVDFDYLFFFTKSKAYWFERQFEPHRAPEKDDKKLWSGEQHLNPLGRNKRAVWTICTKPFAEAHFATYPEALCLAPIQAGCPEFICVKCGKPREKIYAGRSACAFNIRVRDVQHGRMKHADRTASAGEVRRYHEPDYAGAGRRCVGYTDCGCNAGWRPGLVLDPFFGAGTTGLAALKLNRRFLGIELNPEYIRIAKKRLGPLLMSQAATAQGGGDVIEGEFRKAA